MKHGPELSFDDDGRPVLITRAAPATRSSTAQRVRKYLTMMSFRIPALILAAVAYGIWHNGLISLAIIAVSIPLPWIAVLIANDRPPRRAEEPRRYESRRRIPLFPTAERPALEQRRTLGAATGRRRSAARRSQLSDVLAYSQDILRSTAA